MAIIAIFLLMHKRMVSSGRAFNPGLDGLQLVAGPVPKRSPQEPDAGARTKSV
jgi:hypothetical protein